MKHSLLLATMLLFACCAPKNEVNAQTTQKGIVIQNGKKTIKQ